MRPDPAQNSLMNTTPINVSALARELGVSRGTIRRRLEKGWTPAATPPPPVEILPPVAAAPEVVVRPEVAMAAARGWPGLATVLAVIVLAIGALALVINAQAGDRAVARPAARDGRSGLADVDGGRGHGRTRVARIRGVALW